MGGGKVVNIYSLISLINSKKRSLASRYTTNCVACISLSYPAGELRYD